MDQLDLWTRMKRSTNCCNRDLDGRLPGWSKQAELEATEKALYSLLAHGVQSSEVGLGDVRGRCWGRIPGS